MKFNKILLLVITFIIFSSCSLKINFYDDDSEQDSRPYYVNHLYGDEAGQQERITVPEIDSPEDKSSENDTNYNFKFNKKQIKAFEQMCDGIRDYKSQIKLEKGAVSQEDINDFLSCVTRTLPEVHYLLDNYGLYIDDDRNLTEIDFNYSCTKEQGESEIYLLNQEVDRIVEKTNGWSDSDKVKYFHDQIILNCQYDSSSVNRYSAYGCLVEGKAVCEGYTKAMYMLCDRAGIPCIQIIGNGNDNGIIESHTWNMVKINDNWYHVDTTWDDPVTDMGNDYCQYDYFNLTDEEISKEHDVEDNKFLELPLAVSNEEDYFVKSGLFVKDNDDISLMFEKAIEKGLKESCRFISLKFQSREKYNQAIKLYFNNNSEGLFEIIDDVQKRCNIYLKSDNYSFMNNDVIMSVNIELSM